MSDNKIQYTSDQLEDQKYDLWNGTSIAYMIARLMTRTNIPYDNQLLSLEEFKNDMNILRGFIDWFEHNNKKYFHYNFTYENLNQIFSLIDYQVDKKEQIENLMINIII